MAMGGADHHVLAGDAGARLDQLAGLLHHGRWNADEIASHQRGPLISGRKDDRLGVKVVMANAFHEAGWHK